MRRLFILPLFPLLLTAWPAHLAYPQTHGADTQHCAPHIAGNPCLGTGLAPGLNLGAGNPIHVVTGNKFLVERDRDVNVSGLFFHRYYNSLLPTPSLLGVGWRHSYSRQLYWPSQRLQLIQDDGSRIIFGRLSDSADSIHHPAYGTLQRVSLEALLAQLKTVADTAWHLAGLNQNQLQHWFDQSERQLRESPRYRDLGEDGFWLWTLPSGGVNAFDPSGRLLYAHEANEFPVWIERDSNPGPSFGAILKVHNPLGEALDFHYAILEEQVRLSQVDTPDGRIFWQHELASSLPTGHASTGHKQQDNTATAGTAQDQARVLRLLSSQTLGRAQQYADEHGEHKGALVTFRGREQQINDHSEYLLARTRYDYDTHEHSEAPHLIQRRRHFIAEQRQPTDDVSWQYNAQGQGVAMHITRLNNLAGGDGLGGVLTLTFHYLSTAQHDGEQGLTEVHQHRRLTSPGPSPVNSVMRVTPTMPSSPQVTHFYSTIQAGQHQLIRTEGAGCFLCPPIGLQQVNESTGHTVQQLQLDDLQVWRHAHTGTIKQLELPHRGWSGLRLTYDEQGYPISWFSQQTGKTFSQLSPHDGLSHYRNFANGHSMRHSLNPQDKQLTTYYGPLGGVPTYQQHLRQRGRFLFELSNEAEQQQLRLSHNRRSLILTTRRRWADGQPLKLEERFVPNAAQHTLTHHLPEGGQIIYRRSPDNHQLTIEWQPKGKAPRQRIYEAINDVQRRFGNGLQLTGQLNYVWRQPRTQLRLGSDNHGLLWQETRHYDDAGVVQREVVQSEHFPQLSQQRDYRYNAHGQLIASTAIATPTTAAQDTASMERNDRSETYYHTVANAQNTTQQLYAWQPGGASLAKQVQGQLMVPNIECDASGLIQRDGPRRLAYDERRLLRAIYQGDEVLARYQYNALNHRISTSNTAYERHFFYLGQQLIAETTRPTAKSAPTPVISRRYLYDGVLAVAFIDYSRQPEGEVFFIHNDSVGQPVMVTDGQQRVVWQAQHDPFGQAQVLIDEIDFQLRLPGQYADTESGYHYNLYRYYDPRFGHYLEPDPLGPVTHNEAFGYANQQPRQFIDPLGLLLFAFDGTTNHPESQTSPYKLTQLYKGQHFYLEGPGTEQQWQRSVDFFHGILFNKYYPWSYAGNNAPYYGGSIRRNKKIEEEIAYFRRMRDAMEWETPYMIPQRYTDTLAATMAPYALNMQWMKLIEQLAAVPANPNNVVPIDITGFSRGAAYASIFANKIAQYTKDGFFQYQAKWLPAHQQHIQACVDLRFVGLFDTVHQIGVLANRNQVYQYDVSPAWSTFVHAVALNERRKIMTLTSFKPDGVGHDNVWEAPFLGTHSDVGGFIFEKENHQDPYTINPRSPLAGDLGQIPLAWVYDQAVASGVPLAPLASASQWQLNRIRNPLIHFMSTAELGNRKVLDEHGKRLGGQHKQQHIGQHVKDQHMQFSDYIPSQTLVYALVEELDERTMMPSVDARAYLDFLADTMGWYSSLEVLTD